jgi:hypothetical protein
MTTRFYSSAKEVPASRSHWHVYMGDIKALHADDAVLSGDIEALPMNGEALHADNEALPMNNEALPMDNEALHAGSEALHTDSEALHAGSEALHAGSEALSMDSKALPQDIRALPTDIGMVSESVKALHVDNRALPTDNRALHADNRALHAGNRALCMDNGMLSLDNKTRDSCNATLKPGILRRQSSRFTRGGSTVTSAGTSISLPAAVAKSAGNSMKPTLPSWLPLLGTASRSPVTPAVRSVDAQELAEFRGYWFDRTQEYAARNRGEEFGRLKYASEETFELTPLPCWAHLSAEEYRQRVAELVAEIESTAEIFVHQPGDRPWIYFSSLLTFLGRQGFYRKTSEAEWKPRDDSRAPPLPKHQAPYWPVHWTSYRFFGSLFCFNSDSAQNEGACQIGRLPRRPVREFRRTQLNLQ